VSGIKGRQKIQSRGQEEALGNRWVSDFQWFVALELQSEVWSTRKARMDGA